MKNPKGPKAVKNITPKSNIFSLKVEIVERSEKTRKPTAKRVYRTRFNYKIKFISGTFRATDVIYDITNKIHFYVIGFDSGDMIAVSIKPTLKHSISENIKFIKICSACSEASVKTI